jgi:hypothetical protein
LRHHDALAKIRHAEESGQKRLDLSSMGLTGLPPEITRLQQLETLDLSGNALARLPDCLERLGGLRRLFVLKNGISEWPAVVARLPSLEMVSFKSNRLARLPERDYLPPGVRWLMLTDNQLESLPDDFGDALPRLRKLALAGNRLTGLPDSFARLSGLELLRLGLNRLDRRPPQLESLPRLAWLGLGGNPYAAAQPARLRARATLAACRLDPGRFRLGEVLGSGASGDVFRADWLDRPGRSWAVKRFKAVSSDGHPEDELAIAAVAAHAGSADSGPPGIIGFRGWWPEGNPCLVMDYLENAAPLGLVPSLESITRDCYPEGIRFEAAAVRRNLAALAHAQCHLIAHRVIHGDFYAHNILVRPDGGVSLGDWGASFFFDAGDEWMESLEVRAFGCLMEELLARSDACAPALAGLAALRDRCLDPDPAGRPGFAAILSALGGPPEPA